MNLAGAIHKTLAVAAPRKLPGSRSPCAAPLFEGKRSSSPGFGKWFAVLR